MKTARFAAVVEAAGRPDTHLLLVSPEKDKALQAAIKTHRVLTVHQELVGSRAQLFHKSLQRRLAHRVNAATSEGHALSIRAADIDDAAAFLHVFDRCLGGDENRPHVDGQRPIKVLQLEIIDGAGGQHSGVVDENVNASHFRHRAFDCGNYRTGIGTVRLKAKCAKLFEEHGRRRSHVERLPTETNR
jgi:hypothetical protein